MIGKLVVYRLILECNQENENISMSQIFFRVICIERYAKAFISTMEYKSIYSQVSYSIAALKNTSKIKGKHLKLRSSFVKLQG